MSRVILAVIAVACLAPTGGLHASSPAATLENILRIFSKVADDVPIRHTDELVDAVRHGSDAESLAGRATRMTDDLAERTNRLTQLKAALKAVDPLVDPGLLRQLDELDNAALDTAEILSQGARELGGVAPDLLRRSEIIEEGGALTVAAVGRGGPEAAADAVRLREAIRGGRIHVPDGMRPITLADFGRVMTEHPNASPTFWSTYVRPHWEIWAGSGLLVAYLMAPEQFQDAAGMLTEHGSEKLTEFVGAVAAATIRGVGQGAGTAVEDVAESVSATYWYSTNAVYAAVGTVVLLLAASFLFVRIRQFFLGPFYWLSQPANEDRESCDGGEPQR